MRIGHGLNERILELCDDTDTGKSKVVRWLLEGALDTLDTAKKNPGVKLPKPLATLNKRRGADGRITKDIKEQPKISQQLDEITQTLALLLQEREQRLKKEEG